jgi:hypothetical protein
MTALGLEGRGKDRVQAGMCISPLKVCAFWDLMKTKCGRNASSLDYIRLE